MPNGREVADDMAAASWAHVGEVEFSVELARWSESREPLAAAMTAALSPFMPYWLGGFDSREAATAVESARVADLATIFDAWAVESHPQWYRAAADPFPPNVREQLTPT